MSLVAGLLQPRLFSSKLSKFKVTEKYSGSGTLGFCVCSLSFRKCWVSVSVWWPSINVNVGFLSLFTRLSMLGFCLCSLSLCKCLFHVSVCSPSTKYWVSVSVRSPSVNLGFCLSSISFHNGWVLSLFAVLQCINVRFLTHSPSVAARFLTLFVLFLQILVSVSVFRSLFVNAEFLSLFTLLL